MTLERLLAQTAELEPTRKTVLIIQGLSRPPDGKTRPSKVSTLYEDSPAARRVKTIAEDVLGFPIGDITPKNYRRLQQDGRFQTTDFVHTLAWTVTFMDIHQSRLVNLESAFHSNGQHAAWYITGCTTIEDSIKAVHVHEQCTQEANKRNPGDLIRVPAESSQFLIRTFGLELASVNPKGKVILGGPLANLKAAEIWLRSKRVDYLQLNLGGAFHTSAMGPAKETYAAFLSQISMQDPKMAIRSNITNTRLEKAEQVKLEGIAQMDQTVYEIDPTQEYSEAIEISSKGIVHKRIKNGTTQKSALRSIAKIAGAAIGAGAIAAGGVMLARQHRHGLDKPKNELLK